MKRRKFTIGLGSLVAGSAAAVGTGAFTSVHADRSIEVQVSNDADGFLGIASDSEYVDSDGDVFAIDLSGETDAGGEGFNTKGFTDVDEIFTLSNRGTGDIVVGFGDNPQDQVDRDFEGEDGFNPTRVRLTVPEEQTISPGSSLGVDVRVDARDDLDDFYDDFDPTESPSPVEISGVDPEYVDDDDDDNGGGA